MCRSLAGPLDQPANTEASESGGRRGSCGGQGDDTGLRLPSSPAETVSKTLDMSRWCEESCVIALHKRSQTTEGL